MSKSPGHSKFPDHQVREQPVGIWMKVEVDGEVVADSIDVIRVVEDKNPVRYYFPRADVSMSLLDRSATTTECPFKGKANYYTLKLRGKTFPDAVWTYEDPYDEHRRLQGRLAFFEEKVPGIRIEPKT
jgi:uncharacterized protein (DUF427 family)